MTTNQEAILDFFYSNLDTVSRIQDGHKLYINADNSINIEEPYMFQGIWRYCYNVSRKDAIYILNKLFNDIEIYFNAIYVKNIECRNACNSRMNMNIGIVKFNDTDYNSFTTIIEKMGKAMLGIENLKKTYSSDANICNEVDKIIEKIKALIQNFNKIIS